MYEVYHYNILRNSKCFSLFKTGIKYLNKNGFLKSNLEYLYTNSGYYIKTKNKVIGLIVCNYDKNSIELEVIYIHKSFRNKNLFKLLLKAIPRKYDLYWYFHKDNTLAKTAYEKIGCIITNVENDENLVNPKNYLKAFLSKRIRKEL